MNVASTLDSGSYQESPETYSSSTSDCVHHYRIEEATGKDEFLWGECLKCGNMRRYRAWVDPYENMDAGDIAHDLIFKYTRPGEERI